MVQVDRWLEEECFAQQELECRRKRKSIATAVTKNSKKDRKEDIIDYTTMG
jgi:hypothetical protein